MKSKTSIESFLSTPSILLEGGGNFNNAGTIHISELPATLAYMEQSFGLKNLANRVLGSTGKKEFSGDIDLIGGFDKDDDVARQKLFDIMSSNLGSQNVKKQGQTLFACVPIQGFNSKLQANDRTGFVQVDFFPGNPKWLQQFYHAPGQDSKTKGAHRNVAINAIASLTGRKISKDVDGFERPTTEVRFKFGPNGLMKVRRNSIKGKDGQWLKKQNEVELSEYITDMDRIAQLLFGVKDSKLLYSLETIIDAINKYRTQDKEELFDRISSNLSDGDYVDGFDLPDDIRKRVS